MILIGFIFGLFLLFRFDIQNQIPNKAARLGVISAGVLIYFFGYIFSVQHWPGASLFKIVGLLFIVIGITVRLIVKPKQMKKDSDILDS